MSAAVVILARGRVSWPRRTFAKGRRLNRNGRINAFAHPGQGGHRHWRLDDSQRLHWARAVVMRGSSGKKGRRWPLDFPPRLGLRTSRRASPRFIFGWPGRGPWNLLRHGPDGSGQRTTLLVFFFYNPALDRHETKVRKWKESLDVQRNRARYQLAGINQIQVRPADPAQHFRPRASLHRCATGPDIIMVFGRDSRRGAQ